jgi:hypothetical protein
MANPTQQFIAQFSQAIAQENGEKLGLLISKSSLRKRKKITIPFLRALEASIEKARHVLLS